MGAVSSRADMDSGVWTIPNKLDATIRYVTYLYVDHTASAASDNNLYTIQEG